jgi:hypothetical protein
LGSILWQWSYESTSDFKGQADVISFYKIFLQDIHACPLSLYLIIVIKIFVKLPKSHSSQVILGGIMLNSELGYAQVSTEI